MKFINNKDDDFGLCCGVICFCVLGGVWLVQEACVALGIIL